MGNPTSSDADKDLDIVTMGEALISLVPQETGPLRHVKLFAKHVAGAELNLAIGAARLGLKTGWISRVGQDEFGKQILNVLRGEGVDVSQVTTSPQPTAIYFKEYGGWGETKVQYYRTGSAASTMAPEDVNPDYVRRAKVLLLTGITPLLSESCLQATLHALDIARHVGATVVFDPNIRYKLIQASEVSNFFRPLVAKSDIILAGEEELRSIFAAEHTPLADLEEATLALGPQLVVTKRGAMGASVRTADSDAYVPAYEVTTIVDTIGAGDGFNAGFLAGWLRGWELEQCLRLGNLVGATAVGVCGDYEGYPAWDEALTILSGRPDAER